MNRQPMRLFTLLIIITLVLTSCFEEDEMVIPHEQGDLQEGVAAVGPNYERQVFYDLPQNREAASNTISAWDLSFESASGGWIIRLNSSLFMYAGNSGDTVFTADLDPAELEMVFDASHGDPDSTAFSGWYSASEDSTWSQRQVYLVDRGTDEQFQPIGLKKVRFDISGADYLMRFADADLSNDTTVLILRDPSKERIFYSFEHGVVEIEPDPDAWSLLFSKYTTMLITNEGEFYPYLVMGALLNPDGISACLDTIHNFAEVTLADTVDLEFSIRSDVIGYDWKYYNFDAGVYTIVPGMFYIIRERDGFYYKLQFTDFYNEFGEKGYPTFEFARL